jgi:DNA-binding NarL/FixJ family response regulator
MVFRSTKGARGIVDGAMTGQRILLALHQPELAIRLRDEFLLRAPNERLQLIGVIDPRIGGSLSDWYDFADVVLIGADELLWLHSRGGPEVSPPGKETRIIVLVDERQLFEVLGCFGNRFGLLVIQNGGDRFLSVRTELAIAGYIVVSSHLLRRLKSDQIRLELVQNLSLSERKILACLGQAMTNRGIAHATGLSEREIKSLVHNVAEKLSLKNRVAIAVFAASNDLSAAW